MKKSLSVLAIAAALMLSVSFAATAQDAPPITLNGQSFKIDLTDAQSNVTHDVLNFKETSFTCNAIANSTYDATRYTVTKQPDGKLFLYAIAISQTEGTMTWKGHLADGSLEGGMLIEKPGMPAEKRMFVSSSLDTHSTK